MADVWIGCVLQVRHHASAHLVDDWRVEEAVVSRQLLWWW